MSFPEGGGGTGAVPALLTELEPCSCMPGAGILLSADATLCPLQIFDPQLSHRQLDSRCHRPSEAP